MNKYEFALVLNAKIDDETRNAELEKVKGYVERFGGTITNVDEWGKRRLAYEIDHMNEGFYYFIKFESGADTPAEVERRIRIMESVVRYMIIREED